MLVVRFGLAKAEDFVLGKIQNQVVERFIQATPKIATPNTLNEATLETLALFERRLEFRRHFLRTEFESAGKEILKWDNPPASR